MTSSLVRGVLFWMTCMIMAILFAILYPGWWVFIPVGLGLGFTLVERS